MCVPSTKGTPHFGIVWKRNRWSVFEPSITINILKYLTTIGSIWRPSEWSSQGRGQQVDSLSLSLFSTTPGDSVTSPEFRKWRELVDPRTRQRLAEEIFIPGQKSSSWWEEIFIPDRNQAHGGKISPIKDGDPDPNRDLSFISQK